MKRLLIPLALALTLHSAQAGLPFFDPFADATANGGTSYTAGNGLAGQQNNATNIWNEVNTNFVGSVYPVLVAGSLSYAGLPQSYGNSVSFVPANTNQSVRLNFNQTNQLGVTYYSFMLKITSISAVPTTNANNWFAGFSDQNTAQPGATLARVGSRLVTKATNGGFVVGIGRDNQPTNYVYDTNIHNVGETLFIVASYELIGTSSTSITATNCNLWVNPPTNSFSSNAVPTPSATGVRFTTGGDINTNRVAGFVIADQATNGPSGLIDDVRISTTWTDATGGDPAIVTQPANATVPPGSNAVFHVTARGTATLTYQWLRGGSTLGNGGNISGATSPDLTVSGVSSGDTNTYSVIVSNGVGNSVTSISATLSLQTDPVIAVQPQSITNNFGTTTSLQVTPGGTSPFTYLWHEVNVGDLSDTGNITGSQSNILTFTSATGANSGTYWVTVSNINGSVDSSNATVTIIDPYFTVQPVSVTNNAGSNVMFSATAVGSAIFNYQWYKNNNILFDTGNVSGSATPSLTLTNISSNDQGTYFLTVSGTYGTTTSSVVSLTVSTPVSIAVPPSPRTVAAGVRTVFALSASGSSPYFYQWTLGGTPISNANSFFYTVSNAQTSGNYACIVSNSFSSVTSSPVALTVTNALTLSQTNLIVIRVGDGGQTLSLNGNSIYLDQYTPAGAYVNTVTIPDTGSNAMIDIGQDNLTGVNSGATTGSCITRSLDGRYMVIAGYATNLTYNQDLSASQSTNVPRGIGLIESHGNYTQPVVNTNGPFNGALLWRAGIYDGTNNYWGGAAGPGTYYFGFDTTAVVVQSNMANMRSLALYNGDMYSASAQAGQSGVLKVSGLPKTATNGTLLFGGSTGTFDMTVSPNGNLIYVADQRAIGAGGGGIQRWDFNGSTWNNTYTLQIGGQGTGSHGPRYVVADFSGANPVIYTTSNDGTFDNNRIISVVDTGSGSTGTVLVNAGVNQTYRAIQFGPVPNTVVSRPTLSLSNNGTNIVLNWSGSFNLQSSTNVGGAYTNVTGASSPYTNNLGEARRFFRLSN